MHAKSGGSSGEPPDFLFIPAACRSRKDLPRSAGGGDRARNAGYRLRNAEDGGTGTGRGVRGHGHRAQGSGAAGAGAGAGRGTRKTRAWGAGRKTRNAEHVKRGRGHGHGGTGARGAGRRTQNTGYWPRQQNTGNGGTKCRRRKTRARGAGRRTRATGRGQQNTGNAGTGRRRRGIGDGAQAPVHGPQRDCIHPPGPATTGLDRSQPGAIRRRDQSAGTFHGWTPAAGTRNNPPGPFTAGRPPPGPATTRRGRSQPGAIRRGPHPTCRAYESESRRCRRARRTCCCRAAPRPT